LHNLVPGLPACERLLRRRGVEFAEINIEEDPDAEDIVIEANQGKRKVPTIRVGDRFFACSPFNPQLLAERIEYPAELRKEELSLQFSE